MRKFSVLFMVLLLSGFLVSGAWADAVLFDYAFNIDGVVSRPTLTNFDPLSGVATYSVGIAGPGAHNIGAFFDYELSETVNTYFNEYGTAVGAPVGGQSWEIDEPGYLFGNIWTNFNARALDNSNGVPGSAPDDVSMALAWNFILAAGETATINFRMGDSAPAAGFYLRQIDPDSQENIYFSSSLNITGGGQGGEPIPEPATLILLGSGLAGLFGFRKRFRK